MVDPARTLRHTRCPKLRLPLLVAATTAALAPWVPQALAQNASGVTKVDNPEPPVPLESVQAPARLATPPRNPQDDLPDLTVSDWHLAPIRWGGSLIGMVNNFRTEDAGTVTNKTGMLNIRASSHIYQPWFAQVIGNLGLTLSNSQRSSIPGESSVGDLNTRSRSMTYGGGLNLFPQSRFPFQAYVDRSNSRASGDNLTSDDYTSTRISLRQVYRPPVGTENYGLSYDRSAFSGSQASSTVDAVQGHYSVSLDEHSINANARVARAAGGLNGESSRIFNLSGSHLWRPQDGLSVSTTANIGNNQLNYLSGGALGLNQNRLIQVNSAINWIPDEELPLNVYGAVNLISLTTQTNAGNTTFSNFGGSGGLSYRFSNQFVGTANAQFSHTGSGGQRFLITSQSGSLSYSGTPLVFGNYVYNWNTGGTVANQTISGGENAQGSQTATLFLGHSLARSIVFSASNALNLTLGQSVSTGTNTQTGGTNTLVHSTGISWRLGYGERLNGIFSFVAADNLTRGEYSSHYRSFTINGNGVAQISRRASVAASANLNWSRQQTDDSPQRLVDGQQQLGSVTIDTNQARWMGAASIGYTHLSPFDVRNLLYSVSYVHTASQVNQRIIGADPNALEWQVSKALQQRLDYRIGRLSLQVLNSFATVNGKKNASVYFQISRSFGDF